MKEGNNGLLLILVAVGVIFFSTQGGGGCQNPSPPPATVGPRTVLLTYETSQVTPLFQRTITRLRAGTLAEQLKTKGHQLTILDDDLPTPSSATKALQAAAAKAKEVGPPCIVVVDSSSGLVTGSAKVEPTVSPEKLLEFIAASGGG